MTNRQKLLEALTKRYSDRKYAWLMDELEHLQNLNDERDEEDRCKDDAEIFIQDIAHLSEHEDISISYRTQIRQILIEAGFYKPFDEEAWKAGRIVVSGGKPWDFVLNKVKYDSEYTYFDFIGEN